MNTEPNKNHEDIERLKKAHQLLSEMETQLLADEKKNVRQVGEPVAIIGMACRLPGACDTPDQFWSLLKQGQNAITEVPETRWDVAPYYDANPDTPNKTYCKWGGFVQDIGCFDPLFFNISPREAELMDPQQRLFLQECWHAIEDAGYNPRSLSNHRCGVYAGAFSQEYAEILNKSHSLQTDGLELVGNHRSILAARISYFLNLKGPAISLDTACSSSLVAIHTACNAIQNGEVELALAGGVSLYANPRFYVLMSKIGMPSKDGQCFTFDERANGFAPAEGVGVLLLKPLAKAQEDGDQIHAIIRAGGINQDGRSNGITAPNVLAQTELIETVYERANIHPETISYVEAHGTGTALGDPIEIEALTAAFRKKTKETGFCAIGSVKTNIGHTQAAAGVTGIIKVALSLKHKVIPPSLNFKQPNPHIDFENSPFYVNTELKDWDVVNGPRRAAVSSFGFSGTNAHLVLEEYVQPKLSSKGKKIKVGEAHLIVLSAKNEARLRDYVNSMLAFLREGPDISFGELAYTLQMGRAAMEARLALVVSSVGELVNQLSQYDQKQTASEGLYRSKIFLGNTETSNLKSALLIEGEAGAAFIKVLINNRELNKLAQLWVSGIEIEWTLLYGQEKPKRVSLPTYPFARERYWIPKTELRTNDGNGMSHIEVLHPLVHKNSSNLTEQRFSSIFNGAEFFLNDHQVQGEKVLPGVAYLEMARAAGEMAVENATLTQIKDVVWIRPMVVKNEPLEAHLGLYPDERGEIAFEVRTIAGKRQPVVHCQGWLSFGAAAREVQVVDLEAIRQRCPDPEGKTKEACYRQFQQQGLVYGPTFQVIEEVIGNQTETLVRLGLPTEVTGEAYILHPSLLDGALQSMIGLTGGDNAPNPGLYLPFALNKLELLAPLSTTAYVYVTRLAVKPDTIHFNIVLLDEGGRVCLTLHNFTLKAVSQAKQGWYYQPYWERQALNEAQPKTVEAEGDTVLVIPAERFLSEMEVLSDRLAHHYPQQRVIRLILSNKNVRLNETAWEIDPKEEAGMADCLTSLTKIDTLYFLGGLSGQRFDPADLTGLEQSQEQGVLSLFGLVKVLEQYGVMAHLSALKVLTNQTQQLHPQETVHPWSASLSGLTMSLAKEYPAMDVSCIDVVLTTNEAGQPVIDEADATTIVATRGRQGQIVALRQGVKYVRRLASLTLPEVEELPYRPGGVYLILGGAGGIGLETAVHLAKHKQAKLVLVGRSPLSAEKESQLKRIQTAGGEYLYCQADGTELSQMQDVVRQTKEKFGTINGVIHSALVLRDGAISRMDEATFQAVLAPKVTGSVVLAEVVKNEDLDFMLFFSSGQSFWGNAGQGNYAAGSTFEDAYALYLDQVRPYPVKIINWGYWGSVGVVATAAYRQQLAQQGIQSIEVEEGLAAVDQILAGPLRQVAAMKVDPAAIQHLGVKFKRRIEVVPPEYPAVLKETAEQITADLQTLTPEPTVLQQEQVGFEALEDFGQKGLLQAFQQMGVRQNIDERYTPQALARQLRIIPKYQRFFAACLHILAQGGYISLTETEIKSTTKVGQANTRTLSQQQETLSQSYPPLSPHLMLLRTCLQALPQIVTGKITATEVMFPNSSVALVAGIYQGTPLTNYFNQMTALAIKSYIEQRLPSLTAGEKIGIIEVGAGTGGTTAFVLTAIEPYRDHIEYLYTDISQGFTRYGQSKFADQYPFMKFGQLNIEQSPVDQGYDRHRAELVLGANVVHATKNIQQTLHHLKALLKTNGLLILNETSHFTVFASLTFGLLDGWWAFEDGEQRIEHTPLLSQKQWQHVLQAAGFRQIQIAGPVGEEVGQAIILAESDGVVEIVTPIPATRSVGNGVDLNGDNQRQVQTRPSIDVPVDSDLKTAAEAYLKQLFVSILKIEPHRLSTHQTFEQYGIDSIVGIEIVNRLRQDFGPELSATLLFEYMTLEKLVDYFATHHTDRLTSILKISSVQRQPGLSPTPPQRVEPGQIFNRKARFQTKPGSSMVTRQNPELTDIAIIGLNGRYPMAESMADFWQNLKTGCNCIREIPSERWDYRPYYDPNKDKFGKSYSKWGGFIDDVDKFDPLFFNISPREAEMMDPQERLFLETVWATVEDAGYSRQTLAKVRQVGVFVGVMNAGYNQLGQRESIQSSVAYWSIANRVSYLLDWQGPSLAVDTACSSSLTAIHLACESLKRGECQLAVAGGVNLIVHPGQYIGLSAMKMLAADDKVKTFGAGADGFVDGEGVGAVLLKPLWQAEADGDQIYGVIKGSAMNAGGKTSGYTVPNPNAQGDLIAKAVAASGIEAHTISYVEAHGTGTALGDPIEIRGLSQAFADGLPDNHTCVIGSVKSNIGHLESAAGIAGLTKVLLQMKYQQLVPSLHSDTLNPHIDFEATPFQVQRELAEWKRPVIEVDGMQREYPRRAGLSSFGAGGPIPT